MDERRDYQYYIELLDVCDDEEDIDNVEMDAEVNLDVDDMKRLSRVIHEKLRNMNLLHGRD